MTFTPADYGRVLGPLVDVDRRRPLDAGRAAMPAEWQDQSANALFADSRLRNPDMARCCLAGVWLLYDDLDRSHTISQSVATREGSFWHGIMHRREGDFSNAKYWFRQVGDHPVFGLLSQRLGQWEPLDFVDRCQAALQQGQGQQACQDAQQAEWELLFDWCYRQAIVG